ncbi:hypothetical protein IA539_12220 [Gordonia sp. zg691]|uniref:hypothetical protein n=1 Tax=Gordonia jinghuaiqii TaxID=2758710 RepID=UPI00166280A8|nr:hypothetical protein [Gordonia jinghuaiqii]MBD0861972.1 hypothetical protein [Gordonia jinghuaiqii]
MRAARMSTRGGPGRTSRWMLAGVVALLAGVAGGCTGTPDERPDASESSPAESAPSMSKAEVWQAINDNMALVDPEFIRIENTPENVNLVVRYGCATSRKTLMPDGPPWRYQVREVSHPIADLPRLLAGLETLRDVGFEVPEVGSVDGLRDVSAVDARGFSVSISVDDTPAGAAPTVDVSSDSPCVRHPDPNDDR